MWCISIVCANKKPVHIVAPTLYCSLKFCSQMWTLPSPDWCLTPTFGTKHSSIPSPFCEIGEVIVNFDSCHVDFYFIHYVLMIITDNDMKNKLKDAQNWRYKIGHHHTNKNLVHAVVGLDLNAKIADIYFIDARLDLFRVLSLRQPVLNTNISMQTSVTWTMPSVQG